MDAESSKQPTSRNKQERVRAHKLRMSCDPCSSSKTKCDQTRPICIRCQKGGLKCNYSISQRKGKPPAASRNPSDPARRKNGQDKQVSKSAEDGLDSTGLNLHHAALDSAFNFDHDASMLDISLQTYEDANTPLLQNVNPYLSDYTSSDLSMTPSYTFDQDFFSMDISSMAQSTQSTLNDNIFNSEDEFPDVLEIGSQYTPQHANSSSFQDALPTPSSSGGNSPSRRYDCTRLASSTLDSLNLDSQSCSASSSDNTSSIEHSPASFDQILMINKSAVQSAHQLLSCPCSLSQQSNLILSLIIDKILSNYQTIIRQVTSSSSFVFVQETPITIGAYKLDAKDEQRMRMQLVSNELRKAAVLMERYAEKYCGLGCPEREDNGIYTALTSRLRRRLREAVSDIVGALRCSRG